VNLDQRICEVFDQVHSARIAAKVVFF